MAYWSVRMESPLSSAAFCSVYGIAISHLSISVDLHAQSGNARVDMEHQHHIHALKRGMWPRCDSVELKSNVIVCELALDRQYGLVDAYGKAPHVQFLNCRSVDDLRLFTRAWGPLYLVQQPDESKIGTAIRRVDEFQAQRSWLRAVKGMVDACRGLADQRASLSEYLSAEVDLDRTDPAYQSDKAPFIHSTLELLFGFQGDAIAWAESADISSLKRALAFLVETNVTAPLGGLTVEQRGRGFQVKPSSSVHSLWDALRWMLWFDEWNLSPLLCCPECQRIFRPFTAHKTRKYCTYKCAHRATNREWRRKDLLEQKSNIGHKTKGGKNVTDKTR
jgi:hypothetical protein